MSALPGRPQAGHAVLLPRQPIDWQQDALCREVSPEIFYPTAGNGRARQAKDICHACPAITECREYSLANNEKWGVWGGLSEHDRRELRRTRRAGAA
jgi:WhiB family redox-sensing transcriptional regulator